MGWKVFERELKRVGKSVEGEGKRLADRATDELARFAEKQLMIKNNKDKAEAAAAEAAAAAASATPASATPASAVIDTPFIEEIKNPNGLEPGRAYIINTLTFNDTSLKRRTGSEADVERLRKIFRKFGMKVKIASDATLTDVRAMMKKISLFDFHKLSCLVVVIMSHGCKHNLLAAKDGKYSLDADIMTPILKNKSLTSKLKFLAVQAYNGPEHHMLIIDGQEDEPTAIPSEILQVTSSFDGDASNMETGPPNVPVFIKILCEQLEGYGLTKNILDIANALVAEVEKNYKGIPIPMIHTNLTKKFVFGHFIPSDSTIDVDNLEDEDDTSSEEEDLITF